MGKKEDLLCITEAALLRVEPQEMVRRAMVLEGDRLRIFGNAQPLELNLSDYRSIYLIGAGKASAPMAKAAEEILGTRLTAGIIAIKPGHDLPLKRVRTIEGGHPVPDGGSVEAASALTELTRSAGEESLFINLISGGGSALLTLPISSAGFTPSLEDIRQTTRQLLACGATIQEINCIRKHLSAVKGGRLAELIHPAVSVSLILSDVVGDDLQSIASGPTVADDTSYSDARSILKKYRLEGSLPASVVGLIEAGCRGEIEETPKEGSAVLMKSHNVLIGTNKLALEAAAKRSSELGYNTVILTSRLTGEAKEAAKFFSAVARDISDSDLFCEKPACILAGGETTVTIRGGGKGGRNQEMALSFLCEMEKAPAFLKDVLFASIATDGNDGPTDAAGALVSTELLERAKRKSLSPAGYLENNDSYSFFEKTNGLIKTGPTNTNVCDIQILLIG